MAQDTTRHILTVSDLTRWIKGVLEEHVAQAWVEGEASNVKYHQSGHVYFNLKDAKASLRCVMFRPTAARVRFRIEDGASLVVFGRVSVYEAMGTYELIVGKIEPKGVGALQLAFEQLKAKLEKEGLFDAARKRPLPFLPAAVGVVTSSTGAALRDILNVIDRRFPPMRVVIYPCRVQGEGASAEVAAAIAAANRRAETDVLIVGRGGGSAEDLWAFNEEAVARAIHASAIPVVSAVGHEIDITIADLVADKRALTPSEAAELAVPKRDDLAEALAAHGQRLRAALQGDLDVWRGRLKALGESRALRDPLDRVRQAQQRLDELWTRIVGGLSNRLALARKDFEARAGRLESLSPLRVLARGYSVTLLEPSGRIVKSAKEVKPADRIKTRLADGEVLSRAE